MNEVVPWSTRARDAVVAGGRRLGRLFRGAWDWYVDLGFGGWLVGAGALVVCALVIALVQGRSGHEPTACDQAGPEVETISRLAASTHLTPAEVGTLHRASARLSALAPTAHGDDISAITDAAQVAGGATSGRSLQAEHALAEFDAACTYGSPAGGGLRH